ncbi:hypothetical protein GEV33_008010 [Tenebrio molitor]|uniref:Uncharacterized protein n=1 Tax=Tenebrio molitor TaxID=7067 RepID=A0A8J6HIM4_TENMO|nr:hypothetical protein GEV33_008010 [Tenebrio molitor]
MMRNLENKIEKVSEFKYLGYIFNERAKDKAQEVVRKVVGCGWGIGDRKWGGEFWRKIMMFESMVRADVRSRDLGMEGTGGGGESAREIFEMGAKSGQRNTRVHSEGRLQEEQVESESGKESGKRKENERGCEREKENYCMRNGYASEDVERMRAEGKWMSAEMSERDKDMNKQERRKRIRESRYNREYERCLTQDVPVYLRRESAKEREMMERFRCWNEERENRYWTEEEQRRCQMCREENETIEHMWSGCNEMRERERKDRREILSEDGREIEPNGLSRDDGKRPDGMTLVPWIKGQLLVWDVTVVDTLADSYVLKSSEVSGFAAEMACKRKHSKYSSIISSNYVFKGLAFETLGPWCKEAIDFINVIGNRLIAESGDSKSKKFLFERISLAIQRGNAASIRGTFPDSAVLSEIFVL